MIYSVKSVFFESFISQFLNRSAMLITELRETKISPRSVIFEMRCTGVIPQKQGQVAI